MSPSQDGTPHDIYLDDLSVGQRFRSGTRVLTANEIVMFGRAYDPQPFHTDAAAAEATFFGGLAASGWMTAAVTMRLIVESLPLAGGVIGAGGEIAWPRPTRPGDTLQVETEILALAPSRSRPDRGSATVLCTTRNQTGDAVQTLKCRLIMKRRREVS